MYKLLIGDADDKTAKIIEEVIKEQFSYNFRVEVAKTGRQVIEQAEIFCPDILLIDLQISGINVIEVMREVKNIHSNVNIIVSSSCIQFDYIKEAVEIGIADVIYKPVEQEEIAEVLKNVITKIEDEKKRRRYDLEIKEKMEVMVPIVENSFINCFLYGKEAQDDILYFRELLGIKEDSGYFMVLQCEKQLYEKQSDKEEIQAYLKREWPEIIYLIKRYFLNSIGAIKGKNIMVFVPKNELDMEQEYDYRSETMEIARKMVRELKKNMQVKWRVGIGRIHRLDNLSVSLEEARSSLNYNTKDMVVHVNNMPILCKDKKEYPLHIETQLFESIECGNVNETIQHMEQFFEWMMYCYEEQAMDINLKVLEFVLRAEEIGYKRGTMEYPFFFHGKYLEELVKIHSIKQLQQWSEEKIVDVCRNIHKKREESNVDLVKKAKQYIKLNYAKDIDLEEVAKYLEISPYYFCKLFKKKTGKNFIEYLTEVRMEHAKILLENSSKSMKEICVEVGYCDANYFSRIFKKNVGLSPTEYKEEKYGI